MKSIFNTKDITEPKSGLIVYADCYWVCEDGDPKKALFYGRAPQCNKNKSIVAHISKSNEYDGRNIQIVFVKTAYVPPRD